MNELYSLRGAEVFYLPTGKKVAEVDPSGNISMEKGMAGPHTRGVKQFFESPIPSAAEVYDKLPQAEEKSAEETEEVNTDRLAESGWNITEAVDTLALPPFSAALGVDTPGFRDFVARKELSESEVVELIRKCERNLR